MKIIKKIVAFLLLTILVLASPGVSIAATTPDLQTAKAYPDRFVIFADKVTD